MYTNTESFWDALTENAPYPPCHAKAATPFVFAHFEIEQTARDVAVRIVALEVERLVGDHARAHRRDVQLCTGGALILARDGGPVFGNGVPDVLGAGDAARERGNERQEKRAGNGAMRPVLHEDTRDAQP